MVLLSSHQMMVCMKLLENSNCQPILKKSSEVPADSTFAQKITILQTEVKNKCLANKAKQLKQ